MNKQILTFKELREAKGFTQESLARAVGLTRLAIAKYELKQAEPKLGNFLKMARILEVSLAELALAMGYEAEEKSLLVCRDKSAYTPAQNEALERESVQVFNDNPGYTPAKRQSKGAIGSEAEDKIVQVCRDGSACTPAQNEAIGRESVQVFKDNPEYTPAKRQSKGAIGSEAEEKSVLVFNDNPRYTPAKRRAKGKGTGFIEERLVKRGNKKYKQYWFHWQKSERGKRRDLAKSKYIPKRLVAKIIEKNHQKLPVREILQSLGV
ncbi:MAG: helix-turn-helix domain-containing protein [Xenococcus sp. (in: cyanobacteria)]